MRLVHVFVEHPILHLDHTFTYRCYDANVKRGVRVQVPFHKTSIIGFVSKVEEADEQTLAKYPYEIKEITKIIDAEPDRKSVV